MHLFGHAATAMVVVVVVVARTFTLRQVDQHTHTRVAEKAKLVSEEYSRCTSASVHVSQSVRAV